MILTSTSAVLRERYRNRLERSKDAAKKGIPVIGYVGSDVPIELVDAAGALGYRLSSTDRAVSAEARSLLGSAADFPALSILTQILAGDLDFVRGLLISRDCQASLRLFYVLRQLGADGREIPPVHLVDLLHLPRESTARYNLSQVTQAAAVVSDWTGTPPRRSALVDAIRDRRQVRSVLEAVRQARRLEIPTISGTDALRLYALTQSYSSYDAANLITSLDLMTTRRAESPLLRVFVTGSGQDHDVNYAAIESSGAHIVGEDHSWGDLLLSITPSIKVDDILPGLYDALARARQLGGSAASTSGLRDRARFSADSVKAAGAQGVLSLIRKNDGAPGWDRPMLIRELEGQGIPVHKVDGSDHEWSASTLTDAVSALRAARLQESHS